jgi:large subunit ribosomal protein L6
LRFPRALRLIFMGRTIKVKGPKGELSRVLSDTVEVKKENDALLFTSSAPGRDAARLQGLNRALVASMVLGVEKGYERQLEMRGTGFRVEQKGKVLHFALGLSHPVTFEVPAGLSAAIPPDSKGTLLTLQSANKELLGQSCATIRGFRPPEPYKGKGVRFVGERIREKAGKAGKGAKK